MHKQTWLAQKSRAKHFLVIKASLLSVRPFVWAYVLLFHHNKNRRLPSFIYSFLRMDHRFSLGLSTRWFLKISSILCSQILPTDNCYKYSSVVKKLKRDGFSPFESFHFDFDIDNSLDRFKHRQYKKDFFSNRTHIHRLVSSGSLDAGRIDIPILAYNKEPWFEKLRSNQVFNEIASNYFGTPAFPCYYTMWELLGNTSLERTPICAQQFHWDWDVINPLNFFFLCTDTTEDDGPLEYIKGTHQTLPLRHDGIWTESVIRSLNLDLHIERLIGPKGLVYIADNTGIHRDSVPKPGHGKRWLQFTFSPAPVISYEKSEFVGVL